MFKTKKTESYYNNILDLLNGITIIASSNAPSQKKAQKMQTSFGSTAKAQSIAGTVESGKNLVASLELAGFSKEQVKVSVKQGAVTVSASRKSDTGVIDKTAGFVIPSAYDSKQLKAKLENGLLVITAPRKAVAQPEVSDVVIE